MASGRQRRRRYETPLARKLGIKPGVRLGLVGAPAGFVTTLGPLPDGVVLREGDHEPCDVIVAFAGDRSELESHLPGLRDRLAPAGGLWVAWPKRSSGVPSDLDENVVRAAGLAAGLVDNKVCAIDRVWSGLRFVYRLSDRG